MNAVRRLRRQAARLFLRIRLRAGEPTALVRLGTRYGGWWVPRDVLRPGAICYCLGAGEDISFDRALAEDFQCSVVTADPTPRAAAYVNRHRPAGAFRFFPVGVAGTSGPQRFYAPAKAGDVSHSIRNLQGTIDFFEAECVTLAELVEMAGNPGMDLLKLDIEGAEHEVVESLAASKLRPKTVCLEFDQPASFRQMSKTIHALTRSGYRAVRLEHFNATFIHDDVWTQRRPVTPVLALLASRGLGGGIETFVDATAQQIRSLGFEWNEVAMAPPRRGRPTSVAKAAFALRAARAAVSLRGQGVHVIVCHPSLIILGVLAQRLAKSHRDVDALFYGIDIWRLGRFSRFLVRSAAVRAVTISDFSAGAIAASLNVSARVAPVSLDPTRRAHLQAARRKRGPEDLESPNLLSVFRLVDATTKGALVLIAAAQALREEVGGLTLTLAGHGPPPNELSEAVRNTPWIRVVVSPSIDELAQLYLDASLFVLCTRTRPWHEYRPSGEGLGLVLVEAQLAGLAVVGPAGGGSANAYRAGVTGLRPSDESPGALEEALRSVLCDHDRYLRLSAAAHDLAPEIFDQASVRRFWAATLGHGGPCRTPGIGTIDSEGA